MQDVASVVLPKLDLFFYPLTVLFLVTGLIKLDLKKSLLCLAPICVWLAPMAVTYGTGKALGYADDDQMTNALWIVYFVVQGLGALLLWPLMSALATELRTEIRAIKRR